MRRRRRLLLRVQRLRLRRGSKGCLPIHQSLHRRSRSCHHKGQLVKDFSLSNLPAAAAPPSDVPRPNPSSLLRFEPKMLHLMNSSPTSRSNVSSNEASSSKQPNSKRDKPRELGRETTHPTTLTTISSPPLRDPRPRPCPDPPRRPHPTDSATAPRVPARTPASPSLDTPDTPR